MHILKLLEIIQTNQQHNKSSNIFNYNKEKSVAARQQTADKNFEKTGAYGKVYDKGDSHTLTKTNFVANPSKTDAYYTYIKYIVDNDLAQENPYFPRVYDIKTIEDANGNARYKIDIERLQDLGKISKETISAMLWNLFDSDVIDDNIQKYGLAEALAICVELTCEGHAKSKDKYLNEACAIVRKLRNTGFIFDIHIGNIMVRLSPYPQLVIVDPLA
jgi:hypothetical protein